MGVRIATEGGVRTTYAHMITLVLPQALASPHNIGGALGCRFEVAMPGCGKISVLSTISCPCTIIGACYHSVPKDDCFYFAIQRDPYILGTVVCTLAVHLQVRMSLAFFIARSIEELRTSPKKRD